MKHYVGEIVDIYDGDLIGWTKARLIKFIGKYNGFEKWNMISKEGYELNRYVDFDEIYIKK
ncbi:hypothetical protein [Clostridium botulinum]|uniref:hypothetical protein n=1 Tax=Clostridium botulinum TaxID=1491 RepID=UPI0004D90335|nr:hypothetical protein [Clostridium botulinum]KEH90638.1 hypothetical protein Z963_12085 [Clostridium botulinum C/D str. It1]